MIAVSCRNGEFFSVDPTQIERIEGTPDTVVHLVDGTKYVVEESFDDVLRMVRDHHSERTVVQKRLAGGTAEIADHASTVRDTTLFVERRQYSRDGDSPGSAADRRPPAGARDVGPQDVDAD